MTWPSMWLNNLLEWVLSHFVSCIFTVVILAHADTVLKSFVEFLTIVLVCYFCSSVWNENECAIHWWYIHTELMYCPLPSSLGCDCRSRRTPPTWNPSLGCVPSLSSIHSTTPILVRYTCYFPHTECEYSSAGVVPVSITCIRLSCCMTLTISRIVVLCEPSFVRQTPLLLSPCSCLCTCWPF